MRQWLIEHLHDHYGLYGEASGVRSARKHIGWAVRGLPGGEAFRQQMNQLDDAEAQRRAVDAFFAALAAEHGAKLKAMPDTAWLPIVRAKSIAMMMDMIKGDLAALGLALVRQAAVHGPVRRYTQERRLLLLQVAKHGVREHRTAVLIR